MVHNQYKEKNFKDPTVREKFYSYCFADYNEKVIDLLMQRDHGDHGECEDDANYRGLNGIAQLKRK